MPCFSTVTRTKMTDEGRLVAALKALGFDVTSETDVVVARQNGREALRYFRGRAGEAFSTYETDAAQLNAVQRKYTEIGVREWAKRRGFGVAQVENGGRKLTLVNRRG